MARLSFFPRFVPMKSSACSLLACLLVIGTFAVPAEEPPAVPPAPQIEAKGYLWSTTTAGPSWRSPTSTNVSNRPASPRSCPAMSCSGSLPGASSSSRIEALISEKAWRTGGSKMFVEVGHRVRVEDLLKGMIIQSGNDASVALAEHVAGSEHLRRLMNTHAERLGMTNSHFMNADGLAASGALHHRPRHGPGDRGDHPGVPGVLRLGRRPRSSSTTVSSSPIATGSFGGTHGRRGQDRAHPDRRLLPGRLCGARWYASDLSRLGILWPGGARAGEPGATQLRFPVLREPSALSRGQGGGEPAGVEGGRAGAAGRSGAGCGGHHPTWSL